MYFNLLFSFDYHFCLWFTLAEKATCYKWAFQFVLSCGSVVNSRFTSCQLCFKNIVELQHCWRTFMSARSSVSCSSDMDADWSVSRLSSSALFCRASKINTAAQTMSCLTDMKPDLVNAPTRRPAIFIVSLIQSEIKILTDYGQLKRNSLCN